MHHLAEIQRQISNEMYAGNDFTDWQIRNRRQRVRVQFQCGGPRPRALERHVLQLHVALLAKLRYGWSEVFWWYVFVVAPATSPSHALFALHYAVYRS